MERALLERAQSGDRDAYALVVSDRLYAIALRTLRDPEASRDALQAALVQIWRELPSLRDPDRFEGWSYRIVLNCCRALRRRSGRSVVSINLDVVDAPVSDSQVSIAMRDEIERAFGSLTFEQRAVLVLHYYRGLSVVEIADAMGISSGTVKSRLHYARHAMRAAIDADQRSAIRQERPA